MIILSIYRDQHNDNAHYKDQRNKNTQLRD